MSKSPASLQSPKRGDTRRINRCGVRPRAFIPDSESPILWFRLGVLLVTHFDSNLVVTLFDSCPHENTSLPPGRCRRRGSGIECAHPTRAPRVVAPPRRRRAHRGGGRAGAPSASAGASSSCRGRRPRRGTILRRRRRAESAGAHRCRVLPPQPAHPQAQRRAAPPPARPSPLRPCPPPPRIASPPPTLPSPAPLSAASHHLAAPCRPRLTSPVPAPEPAPPASQSPSSPRPRPCPPLIAPPQPAAPAPHPTQPSPSPPARAPRSPRLVPPCRSLRRASLRCRAAPRSAHLRCAVRRAPPPLPQRPTSFCASAIPTRPSSRP